MLGLCSPSWYEYVVKCVLCLCHVSVKYALFLFCLFGMLFLGSRGFFLLHCRLRGEQGVSVGKLRRMSGFRPSSVAVFLSVQRR